VGVTPLLIDKPSKRLFPFEKSRPATASTAAAAREASSCCAISCEIRIAASSCSLSLCSLRLSCSSSREAMLCPPLPKPTPRPRLPPALPDTDAAGESGFSENHSASGVAPLCIKSGSLLVVCLAEEGGVYAGPSFLPPPRKSFLAKNDIDYWQQRRTMVGLDRRCAPSQRLTYSLLCHDYVDLKRFRLQGLCCSLVALTSGKIARRGLRSKECGLIRTRQNGELIISRVVLIFKVCTIVSIFSTTKI